MQAPNAYNLEYVLTTISVCEARKGPSELEVALDILRVCIEMLGKEIDKLKEGILVFMR